MSSKDPSAFVTDSKTTDSLATERLVPPSSYRWIRDSLNIKIYCAAPDINGPSNSTRQDSALISDEKAGTSVGPSWQQSGSEHPEQFDNTTPTFYMEYVKKVYNLWEGAGPKDTTHGPGRRVLAIGNEGDMTSPSIYSEVGGQCREAKMDRAHGPQGDSWWTRSRTLTDYDGNEYLMKTTMMDNLTLIRKSDQVVVAQYNRVYCSLKRMGTLEIKEPVPSSLLYLILGAMAVRCWKTRRERYYYAIAGS